MIEKETKWREECSAVGLTWIKKVDGYRYNECYDIECLPMLMNI